MQRRRELYASSREHLPRGHAKWVAGIINYAAPLLLAYLSAWLVAEISTTSHFTARSDARGNSKAAKLVQNALDASERRLLWLISCIGELEENLLLMGKDFRWGNILVT